ncbi:MAG: hypothetical protein MJB14_23470 [Spirochaetes bacterium]|nr:hypothetical protein [Spirochaetota bacterium]
MGVRAERLKYLKYKKVYDSLQFRIGKKSFRLSGKLNEWQDVELVSRIFYKRLEMLLYTPEITSKIYEYPIHELLRKNDLLDKNMLDIIRSKGYQLEAINIFVIKIFDFVYYTLKKKLPYTNQLSLITNAISELLENIYKYSSREFCITVGKTDSKYSLVVKIENNYQEKNEQVQQNILKLKKGIKEVEKYDDPNVAFAEIMKDRVLQNNPNSKESRLGFAKIRVDTNAKIVLQNHSHCYGDNGITINLFTPFEFVPAEQIEKIIADFKKH